MTIQHPTDPWLITIRQWDTGEEISVVYAKEDDNVIVITVFWGR